MIAPVKVLYIKISFNYKFPSNSTFCNQNYYPVKAM